MTEQLDWLAGGLPPFDVGEQHLEPIPLDKDRLTRPEELVPQGAVFRVTNNYIVEGTTLSQLLRAFDGSSSESKLHDISAQIGLPYAVTKAYRSIAQRMLLVIGTNLTPLGRLMKLMDPHFLNGGGLWLIHYLMASNPYAIIWSRLFNYIFLEVDEIRPIDSVIFFQDCKSNYSEKEFRKVSSQELRCHCSIYSEGLLRPLGLVAKIDKGLYGVITDTCDIPPLIWLASILAYRERYYPSAATLETHLITEAHFSPGRLFRQNEKTVRAALDALHNLGLLTVERNLGLDQVRFKDGVTWLGAVARHLQEGQ